MEKYNRILRHRPFRLPWWKAVDWNVAITLLCWMLFVVAMTALGTVILFGSFLREVFG